MEQTATSHDLATSLRELAEKLETKPSFKLGTLTYINLHFWMKQEFIAAAKVLGGTKKASDYSYQLLHNIGPLEVSVSAPRESVCRLVKPAQEAIYECDPLLSPTEEAEILNG